MKTANLTVRMDLETKSLIHRIEEETGINPGLLVRASIEAAAEFLDEHGYLELPMLVVSHTHFEDEEVDMLEIP